MTMLSANETLDLIRKQWATVEDIQLLGRTGINKAQTIKKQIKEEIEKTGKKLPYGVVPMEKVVEYYDININYLKKVSIKEGQYEK